MSKYRKAGVHTKHDLDDQREKKHFYTMLQTPFSETTIDEEIVPMFIYQRHKYLKHSQGTYLHTQNRTGRSRRHGIQNRALWKSLSPEKKKERKKSSKKLWWSNKNHDLFPQASTASSVTENNRRKRTSVETKGEYGIQKSSAEAPNKKGFFMRILLLRGHKSSKQLQFLAKFHTKKTVP